MNKKEIRCPCNRCKNDVLWAIPESIHDHLLEKCFIDNYLIWTKHGEIGANAQDNTEHTMTQGNTNRKGRKPMMILMCSMIVMVVKASMRKNCCVTVAREELLENRKRDLDNLQTMEKALNELLYEESKGSDKECTIL
jgi:hypothetical protein